MSWRTIVALGRLGTASLILTAIGTQFKGCLDDPYKSTVMFWSEFTYQSSLVLAIVLLIGAWVLWMRVSPGSWWDLVRGATATYAVMTFVIYQVLVEGTSNTPNDGHHYYQDWASITLHKVVPILLLIDWIIVPPATRLAFKWALAWTIYPLAYCGYTLIRGQLTGWYPYSFLSPEKAGGWLSVGGYVLAIAGGFLLLSVGMIALGNFARHWPPLWSSHRGHRAAS